MPSVPAMGPAPAETAKLDASIVTGSIGSLKATVTCTLIGTWVEPPGGLTAVTTGAVASGRNSVVKLAKNPPPAPTSFPWSSSTPRILTDVERATGSADAGVMV